MTSRQLESGALFGTEGTTFRALESESDTTFFDDFERADGPLGSNYIDLSSVFIITGGSAAVPSGFEHSLATINKTFSNDQYVEAVISPASGVGDGVDLLLRFSGSSETSFNAYDFWAYLSSPGEMFVGFGKVVTGTYLGDLANVSIGMPTIDFTLRGEIAGSTWKLFYNGVMQATGTDTTFSTGTVAMQIWTQSAANPYIRSIKC